VFNNSLSTANGWCNMTAPVRPYHYQRIDVFTDTPFCGKPLTVFTNASGLTAEQMQRIARELNSTETTFLFPPNDPTNDYSVRVFGLAGFTATQTAGIRGRRGSCFDVNDDADDVRAAGVP
jgi:Phenazine biosynthesis-like protein